MEMVLGSEVNGRLVHQGKDELKKANKSMSDEIKKKLQREQVKARRYVINGQFISFWLVIHKPLKYL